MTKRKGRRRSRREKREERRPGIRRRSDPETDLALRRAERWLDRDRPGKAVDLLEPLSTSAPKDPDLHYALGYAYARMGDVWSALPAFERAASLDDDPRYLLPLAALYVDAGLQVHGLRILRELIDDGMPSPFRSDALETVTSLQQDLIETADHLDRPVEEVEEGVYYLERGRRAMVENDFPTALTANRRAIERLGDWPPPHNNLSQVLFHQGHPAKAVEEVRRVLADHPDNVQALANGIRFLTWSGREEEARELWAQLQDVAPQDVDERLKKAEAAAVLREHETVYRMLRPVGRRSTAEQLSPGLLSRARYFLAVAEANIGQRRQAERYLRELGNEVPLAAETLAALKAGQSGTGWADHFRYFHLGDLLPEERVDELFDILTQEDRMSPERFRRSLDRFIERFPQVVPMAEKVIWEEQQPELGIDLLSVVGTPAAYAALRRFGESQAGDDEARLQALTALADAGEIQEHEPIRIWLDGVWREIELRLERVPPPSMGLRDYAPPVVDALNRALDAQKQGDVGQAEELFEHALELDPDAKEAHNNLGAIYARREEDERAKEAFRRAIEIDPLYIFPLGNLTNYLLHEGQIEEAEDLLAPLADAEELFPEQRAFYHHTRARILVEREDYEDAEASLRAALEAKPDYEKAEKLLEWVEGRHQRAFWERRWERDRAWREQRQQQINTLKPTLAETLPLYTKTALTETGWKAMPWGGWSSLRKAELIDAIIEALTDRENLARVVESLTSEEREALQAVLDHDGAMAWDDFDARYDNDLDESRYWEYHAPETIMGNLRMRGLLAEATADDELYVVIPADLRDSLSGILG